MGSVGTGAVQIVDSSGDAIDDAATGALKIKVDSGGGAGTHGSSVVADGTQILGEAKVVDGSVFPNIVSEGQDARLACSRYGVTYTTLTNDSGAKPAINIDASGMPAAPVLVNVGGEYRSSYTSYSDGDAALLQLDAHGFLRVSMEKYALTLSSDSNPNMDTQTVVGTYSLLAGRVDANTTVGITCEDSTHNALHVAITDGAGIANINSSNQLEVEVKSISAGDNNIGNVDIASIAAGDNNIGNVDIASIAAGDNNIGNVDIASITAGSNIIGKVGHDITGGGDGVTTVSSAGTDVALASSTACKKVDIQAQTDNTGLIAVGFTSVDATEATGTGVILYAGDVYSLEISDLNLIYIDATVSGEGVRYTYFT